MGAMVRERIRGTFFGFFDFIRERGVAGFAIGFILGGAAQKLVQSLMDDIINPLLGVIGGTENLTQYVIGEFKVGNFVSAVLNFFILCVVIYIVFKILHLEKLDKPKG
jgi:large conductance mechanosensitive channel